MTRYGEIVIWNVLLYWGTSLATRGLFYWHGVTLIPRWISNHMPSKVWGEITYLYPNFNSCAFEVWNVTLHFIKNVITLSTLRIKLIHVNKRSPWDSHPMTSKLRHMASYQHTAPCMHGYLPSLSEGNRLVPDCQFCHREQIGFIDMQESSFKFAVLTPYGAGTEIFRAN